jgi:Sulfotransferase domain
LLILGYSRVWHGFDLPSTPPNDCAIWAPLLQAKARGKNTPGRKFDSDLSVGGCDGVMDMPPWIFAEELLDFYPEAKLILNRRKDMDAWHRSLNEAVEMVVGSWGYGC